MEKSKELLFLPLPKSKEENKIDICKERIRKKKEEYVEALRVLGTKTLAMRKSGIKNWQDLKRYRMHDEYFVLAEENARKEFNRNMDDMVVNKLYSLIKGGNMKAIAYYLNRMHAKFKIDKNKIVGIDVGGGEINQNNIFQFNITTIKNDNRLEANGKTNDSLELPE